MKKSDDPSVTLPASGRQPLVGDMSSSPPPSSTGGSSIPPSSWDPGPRRSIPAPPPLHATVPVAGMVLGGKYRIDRVLGSGGIAVVAQAYHLQLHRPVAIKYLLVEALEYPELVERFIREARAAARIRGEHVARVIDVGVFDGGAPYTVFEYLDGMDLEEYLKRRGRLPVRRAVRYILQVCEALAEAHAAKIVHRDLKPANLFLAKTPDRRKLIKVLDFGVSKIVDEPMTDPSRMLGTVMYMSPEQLKAAREVDLRTDIWSLGVILYELLAGEAPFAGQTIVSVAQAVERNQPKPLSTFRSDVPEGLEAVIARCMRSDPAERHASVLALAVALAPFVQSRDRDSVRTITGVLQGSIPPNSFDSGAFDHSAFALMMQLPAVPALPNITPPPPLGSDAPVITSVETAKHAALPAPPPPSMSWLRSRTVGLIAAAMAIGVVFACAMTIVPRQPAAEPAVAVPAEIRLRITSTTPKAHARIDDGPSLPLPLEQTVPRDELEHAITVEAEGHLPQTTKVKFGADLQVAMSLPVKPGTPP